MAIAVSDVHKDMEVYDADGVRMGRVDEVWVPTPVGMVEKSRSAHSAVEPLSGSHSPDFAGTEGYIKVVEGGLLGAHQHELAIPVTEVASAALDTGVRLGCSAKVCEELYTVSSDPLRGE